MQEEYRPNTSEQMEKTARTGIKIGSNAAKSIAKVRKMHSARDVASAVGNTKKTRTIAIALAVAMFSLIIICVFFAGPGSLFERLQGFSERVQETYESELYGDEVNNGFEKTVAGLKAFISGISEGVSEIWKTVSGQTADGEGQVDKDIPDDRDILVMGDSDALRGEYQKKINAVLDKYSNRTEKLKESVEAVHSQLTGWVGTVCFQRDKATFLREEQEYESQWNNIHDVSINGQNLHEGYWTGEDMYQIIYGGLNLGWYVPPLTSNQAVELIALCSAQYCNSINNIKPSQLMRWLGYFESAQGGPQIADIGGTGISSIPLSKYAGDFMPQYLIDEMVQNQNGEYSSYMAPAIDALIEFRAPSFEGLTPHIEDADVIGLVNYTHPEYVFTGRYQTKTVQEKQILYGWFYRDTGTSCSEYFLPQKVKDKMYKARLGQVEVSLNKGREIEYKSYSKTRSYEEPDYDKPIYEWKEVTYQTSQVKKIKIVTYTANLSICPRNIGFLSELAGLYDGEKLIGETS